MTGRGRLLQILTSIVGNAFAPLAALATAPIMAQSLGVDGRGAVAAAVAPLLLATAVASFGLPVAVTYFVARSPELARCLLGRSALVSIGLGIAVSAVVAASGAWLSGGNGSLARLIVLAGMALTPTLLGGLLNAAAAGRQLWHHVALERLVTNGARLVAMSALSAFGLLTISTCVAVLALSPALGAVVYVRRVILCAPRTPLEFDRPALLSYGARVWLGSLSGVILSRVDQMLMTPIAGTTELGLYVVAVSISELPLIVNSAVREVTFSSDAASADATSLARAARLSTMATGIAALCVGACAWWAVPWLFGTEFSAALPVCCVLLAGVAIGTPGSLAGVGLATRGRPGLRSLALTIACLVNVALMLALVGPWGALGAALATLAGNVVSSTINIGFMRTAFRVPMRGFYGIRADDLRALSSLRRSMTRHTVKP